MIVPMKRVTVLCLESDRDAALERLREIGVLHLAPDRPPAGDALDAARAHLQHVRRALDALSPEPGGGPGPYDADAGVEEICEILRGRREDEAELQALRHEEQRLAPFGSFDPRDLDRLREAGIRVRLFQAPAGSEVPLPGGAVRADLGGGDTASFAIFEPGAPDREPAPVEAQEIRLPERSLDAVREAIAAAGARQAERELALRRHGRRYSRIAAVAAKAGEEVEFLEARQGMEQSGPVAWLRGYCPAERVPEIREAAARHGWGVRVREPGSGEEVPTLLRAARWARPIQALYDLFGILPGYRETDISPVFLLFFSVFFGMLVGDAGYGALFLLGAVALRRKMPTALFGLLAVTAVATIAWGALSGVYFGMTDLPAPLSRLRVDRLTDHSALMELCFLLGAVHLTVAHGWKAFQLRRRLQGLAHLGWIGSTWGMFLLARHLILGRGLPPATLGLLGAGVAAVVLFMTPPKRFREEWFNHAMLPLTVIGNFVDIVSYVRLFAVGAATLAVGAAFNEMLGGLIKGPVSGLIFAAILFAGHALNIGMAILGVMVHGVRLNTLEFSQHMEITWKGFAYRPFAKRAADGPAG